MRNYNNLAVNASMNDLAYNGEKLSNSDIHYAATCIKAMSHPIRLKILFILARSEKTNVRELVEQLGTSQSNISQHLLLLKQMGVLNCERQANRSYYRIENSQVFNLLDSVRAVFLKPE